MLAPVNKVSALSCHLCNTMGNENPDCWKPSSPPKKVTECGTGACRSHLLYKGLTSQSQGQATPQSMTRSCAEFEDPDRAYFLEKMKQKTNGSSPKVICVPRKWPCQHNCYCAEDLCNNWPIDQLGQVGLRYWDEDSAEANCSLIFNETASLAETEAKASSVGAIFHLSGTAVYAFAGLLLLNSAWRLRMR